MRWLVPTAVDAHQGIHGRFNQHVGRTRFPRRTYRASSGMQQYRDTQHPVQRVWSVRLSLHRFFLSDNCYSGSICVANHCYSDHCRTNHCADSSANHRSAIWQSIRISNRGSHDCSAYCFSHGLTHNSVSDKSECTAFEGAYIDYTNHCWTYCAANWISVGFPDDCCTLLLSHWSSICVANGRTDHRADYNWTECKSDDVRADHGVGDIGRAN
mmetsp:Transcript_18138/g.28889  ORF Transcript_18138/g.28889 Transcript_18138/m.28889 type:complete len:213 (-) Transcript_18138:318-956(-)